MDFAKLRLCIELDTKTILKLGVGEAQRGKAYWKSLKARD
jgi:hypothetical protein